MFITDRNSHSIAELNLYHVVHKSSNEQLEIKYRIKKVKSKKHEWSLETFPRSTIYASGRNGPLFRIMRPIKLKFSEEKFFEILEKLKKTFIARKRLFRWSNKTTEEDTKSFASAFHFRGSYDVVPF